VVVIVGSSRWNIRFCATSRTPLLPLPRTLPTILNIPQRPRMSIPWIRLRSKLEAPRNAEARMPRQIPNIPERVRLAFKQGHEDTARLRNRGQ